MILSQIAAMAKNRVIGRGNDLPWHIPEDLKYFKRTTKGHMIVMGRKTFESVGVGKPLPNRLNIVVTRDKSFQAEGIEVFHSIDEAILFCESKIGEWPEEVFICGGSEIYRQTLDRVDKLYITEIDREYEGDTFFPEFESTKMKVVSEDLHEGDPSFRFLVYERTR